MVSVMTEWQREFGSDATHAKDVVAKANSTVTDIGSGRQVLAKPDLHSALLAVAGKGGAINNQAFGTWLGKQRDRVVGLDGGKVRLTESGKTEGRAMWKLEPLPKDPKPT